MRIIIIKIHILSELNDDCKRFKQTQIEIVRIYVYDATIQHSVPCFSVFLLQP